MKKNVDLIRKIALSRMDRLFTLAETRAKENTGESERLSRRYTHILREISTHYKISMPKKYSDRICKNCGRLLVPGVNCTVRAVSSGGYAAYRCTCGTEKHIFYRKSAG